MGSSARGPGLGLAAAVTPAVTPAGIPSPSPASALVHGCASYWNLASSPLFAAGEAFAAAVEPARSNPDVPGSNPGDDDADEYTRRRCRLLGGPAADRSFRRTLLSCSASPPPLAPPPAPSSSPSSRFPSQSSSKPSSSSSSSSMPRRFPRPLLTYGDSSKSVRLVPASSSSCEYRLDTRLSRDSPLPGRPFAPFAPRRLRDGNGIEFASGDIGRRESSGTRAAPSAPRSGTPRIGTPSLAPPPPAPSASSSKGFGDAKLIAGDSGTTSALPGALRTARGVSFGASSV